MYSQKRNERRCAWVVDDPLYLAYHDTEWGVPVYDERKLFEFLILEGAQAGLSWITVLRKRSNYDQVFNGFDPSAIAAYDQKKITELLNDPGIIRNRLKVESAVINARAFLKVKEEYGDFTSYIWQFVGGKPKLNRWRNLGEIPAATLESDSMSRDLKRRNFKFVGSTICYAFMQAVGMVNDHTTDCFRYSEISGGK
jgi:DNA-3-methyladenine glycosylase I